MALLEDGQARRPRDRRAVRRALERRLAGLRAGGIVDAPPFDARGGGGRGKRGRREGGWGPAMRVGGLRGDRRPATPSPRPRCRRPRRPVRVAVRRRAQRQQRGHRAAGHPCRPRDGRLGGAVGDQHLRAAVREPAAAGRASRRPRRPSAAVHDRPRRLRGGLAAVRRRALRRGAGRGACGHRHRGSAHGPRGARAAGDRHR